MKKLFALLLAVIMVMTMFAACGEAPPVATDAPASEAVASAPASEAAPAEAPAAVSASLTMGTGGESGTYYAFGGVLGNVIGQKSEIAINVVSTGGSKDNLVSMNDNIYQLATVQSDVMAYAYQGTNSFAESGAITSFRVLGALYAETVQIVTIDPEIKSVADLKGKSVCIGDVGSGTYYNTIDVLAAYDMTLEDINPVYQSFGDSTESLKDGKIDAAFLCAGAPTTAVTELAASTGVNMVSIDEEHMEKLLASCPYYASYTIPGGTYQGFDQDTTTITVKATLVCSADIDEDVAYNLTKIIFDNKEEITGLHAKGAELDLTFATDGIAVPFHAGAAKYFSENGVTVETAA